MKFDQDLCKNLWYELNPRVRCAFVNVSSFFMSHLKLGIYILKSSLFGLASHIREYLLWKVKFFGALKLDTGQKKIFPELTFSPQIPSPLFRLDLAELIGKSQRRWLFKIGRKCKTSHLIQQSFQRKNSNVKAQKAQLTIHRS